MYKKEEQQIVTYVKMILNNVENKGVYLTKFLSVREQEILKTMCGVNYYLYFSGGFEQAKRKRCLISSFECDKNQLKVRSLKVYTSNNFYKLTHPSVKWYFLNMGFDERMFGDIISVDNYFVVNLAQEITKIVYEETTHINKCAIKIDEMLEPVFLEEKQTDIAYSKSLRLDSVCAKCFKLSRKKAQDLIESDLVKINGVVYNKFVSRVNINDAIVITGYGKIVIKEIVLNNKTKRYRIYYNKYFRK